MIRFRERIAGALVDIVDAPTVEVPERGPRCGDGLLAGARAVLEARITTARGRRLDLRGIEVVVAERIALEDGFRAMVSRGSVAGIARRPLPVVGGFVDLSVLASGSHTGARRLYYRIVVRDLDRWYVVEGAKELHGGAHRAWWEATAVFARVARLDTPDADRFSAATPAERLALVAERFAAAHPVAAGVLRMRGVSRRR